MTSRPVIDIPVEAIQRWRDLQVLRGDRRIATPCDCQCRQCTTSESTRAVRPDSGRGR